MDERPKKRRWPPVELSTSIAIGAVLLIGLFALQRMHYEGGMLLNPVEVIVARCLIGLGMIVEAVLVWLFVGMLRSSR